MRYGPYCILRKFVLDLIFQTAATCTVVSTDISRVRTRMSVSISASRAALHKQHKLHNLRHLLIYTFRFTIKGLLSHAQWNISVTSRAIDEHSIDQSSLEPKNLKGHTSNCDVAHHFDHAAFQLWRVPDAAAFEVSVPARDI